MKVFLVLILLVCVIFYLLNYTLLKSKIVSNFLVSFECGFDAVLWQETKMSIHFFKIGVIFVLFDLELMFLLFLLKMNSSILLIILIHLFIFLTFFVEIFNKILKWSF